jgi:hypothetical protein
VVIAVIFMAMVVVSPAAIIVAVVTIPALRISGTASLRIDAAVVGALR